MSAEHIESSLSTPEPFAGYTDAVRYVMGARQEYGNNTAYDRFLCDYIGDPRARKFRPIHQQGPQTGHTYGYNNLLTMHNSFTAEGTMLNIRHVDSALLPGDEKMEYFVATVDLRTGVATEWQIAKIKKHDGTGDVKLALSAQGPTEESAQPVGALLELNSRYGLTFVDCSSGRGEESLEDITKLVTTVNYLTEQHRIVLDRRDVGSHIAEVIALDAFNS